MTRIISCDGQTEIYYADGVKPIKLDGDFDIEIWGQEEVKPVYEFIKEEEYGSH